jgi:prophage DNA circulation protein
LGNLSGVNTGDQDLSALATKTALGDSTAQVRSEIPDVSGFLTSYTETDPTYTSSEAANITATDITNLGNLSGVNTGDQDLSALATKTALGDSTAQVRSEIPDVSGFLTSYTETDPTFTSSQAANITAGDITNLGNLSGVNTGDQDGSETKVTAGTNVTITGAGTTASPYIINSTASGSGTHYLGEEYLGGIIFNLYTTSDGTQHGLIVSKTETVAT